MLKRRKRNLQSPSRSYQQSYFIVILILGFLIQFSTMAFGRFAYTVLLPAMKSDLGLDNTHMGFFQVGILSGYILLAYLCNIFSKRWGAAAVVSLACAVAGFAMTALGLVSSFALCLLFAFLIGAGAVAAYIPLVPLLIGWSSTRWSGSAIGFAMSGTGLGIITVGWLAPLILDRFGAMGWRYAWFILGGLTLLVALLSAFFLRENPLIGNPQPDRPKEESALALLLGNPSLRAILTVYILVGFGYIMYATFIVAYAVEEVGLSVKQGGLIWSVFGLFAVIGCFVWGVMSDRLGRKPMAVVSLLLLAGSILLAVLWKSGISLLISGALFAFNFNGLITLIASMFGDHLPVSKMGRVFGISTLLHASGQAVGVALAGYLKDLTATFVAPFLLSAVMIGICPVFLLRLRDHRGVENAPNATLNK